MDLFLGEGDGKGMRRRFVSWSPFVQYDVKKVQGKCWQNVGKDVSGIATEPSAKKKQRTGSRFRS